MSILITFSNAYFVLPPAGAALLVGCAVAIATFASAKIWSLAPNVQRNRNDVVLMVAAIALCYCECGLGCLGSAFGAGLVRGRGLLRLARSATATTWCAWRRPLRCCCERGC